MKTELTIIERAVVALGSYNADTDRIAEKELAEATRTATLRYEVSKLLRQSHLALAGVGKIQIERN